MRYLAATAFLAFAVASGLAALAALSSPKARLYSLGKTLTNLARAVLQLSSKSRARFEPVQKEVIDRMVASPCTSDYGRLSVMLQWRYDMENVLFVPPESFDPPPRVDSAVVRMVPLQNPPQLDFKLLESMVQVAFSQRRKLLRHTLGRWLEERQFAGVFDVQRRAEEVPVSDYIALVQAL